MSEIDFERFESAYHLFFIDSGGDGKLLGKNAVWQMIVFSLLNKVNFFLHIASSNPVGTARVDNLMISSSCFCFYSQLSQNIFPSLLVNTLVNIAIDRRWLKMYCR